MTPSSTRARRWPHLAAGTVVLGACGACCAGPLLALLGGISVASPAGAVLVPALAILAVLAVGVAVWLQARRRRARRSPSAAPVIDLGLPTTAQPPRSARTTSGVRR